MTQQKCVTMESRSVLILKMFQIFQAMNIYRPKMFGHLLDPSVIVGLLF